jgi:hypothetical protein
MIPSPQDQNTEETQLVDSPVPQFRALDFISPMPQLKVSEAKLKALESRQPVPKIRHGRSRWNVNDADGDIIECQCGYNGEESDMVR